MPHPFRRRATYRVARMFRGGACRSELVQMGEALMARRYKRQLAAGDDQREASTNVAIVPITIAAGSYRRSILRRYPDAVAPRILARPFRHVISAFSY